MTHCTLTVLACERDSDITGLVKIAGLVLAAGAGQRFGGPKALVELEGEPLVARTVRLLREGGCTEILVVIGASADEVRDRAALLADQVVVAEHWEQGQGASLRAGLDAAAASDVDAVVVALVDQPWIGAEAVHRLGQAASAGAEAAVATYGGQPRNPVLLARAVWGEVVEAAVGDVGARVWLRANPGRVVPVPCDGTGDPRDVDTPEDLDG